jgi:hypothetical protein
VRISYTPPFSVFAGWFEREMRDLYGIVPENIRCPARAHTGLTGHFGISVVRETNLNLRTGHWLVIGSSTDLKSLLPTGHQELHFAYAGNDF